MQLNPSPLNPGRQVQVKLPMVLVQSAEALQPPLCTEHSSMSASSHNNNNNNNNNKFVERHSAVASEALTSRYGMDYVEM